MTSCNDCNKKGDCYIESYIKGESVVESEDAFVSMIQSRCKKYAEDVLIKEQKNCAYFEGVEE